MNALSGSARLFSKPHSTSTAKTTLLGACSAQQAHLDCGTGLKHLQAPSHEDFGRALNLPRLREGLDLLGPGEVHEAYRERFQKLEYGVPPLDRRMLEGALQRVERLDSEQIRAILARFYSLHAENPAISPLPNFHEEFTRRYPPLPGDDARHRSLARSLLERGLPPYEEVEIAAAALRCNLLDTSRDHQLALAALAAVAATTTAFLISSPPAGVGAGLVSFLGLRHLGNQPSPHNEAAYGYVLESLDACRCVSAFTGGTPKIESTLKETFYNPNDPENCGSMWRAMGFILSRALRVMGQPNNHIHRSFQELSTLDEETCAPMQKLYELFDSQRIEKPSSVITFLIEENLSYQPDVNFRNMLDELTYAHISWLALEAHEVRRTFAEQVIAHT